MPAEQPPAETGGVLIAGVGNIFLGDDAFGVEVARRLSGHRLPPGVQVADFGIRALHLAYELLDGGYGTTILVDATSRGEVPGTVYLIEPELAPPASAAAPQDDADPFGDMAGLTNAHGVTPDAVFRLLATLGGKPGRVLLVGCEPDSIEERMGLSDTVERAVGEAVALILDLLRREGLGAAAAAAPIDAGEPIP